MPEERSRALGLKANSADPPVPNIVATYLHVGWSHDRRHVRSPRRPTNYINLQLSAYLLAPLRITLLRIHRIGTGFASQPCC